jgi:hypothetical protein
MVFQLKQPSHTKAADLDCSAHRLSLCPRYQSASVAGSRVAQSVVCLATDWTTGRSRFDPRQGQRIFPLASVSRPALGSTQPPVQWAPRILSGGKARPGRDADHSAPSGAEIVNE